MAKQHSTVVLMQSEYGSSARPYLWRMRVRVGCMKTACTDDRGGQLTATKSLGWKYPHKVRLASADNQCSNDTNACFSGVQGGHQRAGDEGTVQQLRSAAHRRMLVLRMHMQDGLLRHSSAVPAQ